MIERNVIRHKRHPLEEVVPLGTPYSLYIDPCGACNLKCNFCPCNTTNFMHEERHKMMSLELFKKIVKDLKDFSEKIRVINLYNYGEPLLNKELIRMIQHLKESDVCDEIRICTNGTLLNPKLNTELAESGINTIRISMNAIDGPAYKKICAIELDYDELCRNLADLYQKTRGKAEVVIKLSNVSINELSQREAFFKMYESIADYIFIEDIEDSWPDFKEIVIPEGSVKKNNNDWKKDKHDICAFGFTTMSIHSNGWVSPCCTDWRFGAVYGDVNKSSVKEIWESQALREFQLAHLKRIKGKYPICDVCRDRPVDSIDDVADIIIKRLEDCYEDSIEE